MSAKTVVEVLREARALVEADHITVVDAIRGAAGCLMGPVPSGVADAMHASTGEPPCFTEGCICALVSWEGVTTRRSQAEVLAAFDKAIAAAEVSA